MVFLAEDTRLDRAVTLNLLPNQVVEAFCLFSQPRRDAVRTGEEAGKFRQEPP